MSAYIYSTRLFKQKNLLGTGMFVVPSGFVCVVREVDIFSLGPLVPALFTFQGPDGENIWAQYTVASKAGSFQWVGRAVFDAGDTMYFNWFVSSGDVYASGYLLSSP